MSSDHNRSPPAWTAAIGILVVAQLVLGVCFYFQRMPEWIGVIIRCAPILAALTCSLLVSRYKLISGVLVFIPATLLEVTINLGVQVFGAKVDLPGWRGALVATEMAMIFNGIFCTLGALLGVWLSNERSEETAVLHRQ